MTSTPHQTCPDDRFAAALQEAQRDTAGGLAAVQALLRDFPGDARLHFLSGALLAESGRFADAASPFAEAVRLDPTLVMARFQLGLLQLSSGDPAAAANVWEPLRSLPATDSLKLFVEGLLRLSADDFVEAEQLLREGVRLNTAPMVNRDMQLVMDRMAEAPALDSSADDLGSSASLLLHLSSRGTRH